MKLTLSYQHYIEAKLHDPELVSQAEQEASYCSRHLGARDDFMLILIRKDCIETYRCHCTHEQETMRLVIDDMDQYPFSFDALMEHLCDDNRETKGWNAMFHYNGQRYEYDTYYDQYLPPHTIQKITDFIKMIPGHHALTAYIEGEHTDFNMLMYALQTRFAAIQVVPKHSGTVRTDYDLGGKLTDVDLGLSLGGIHLSHWLDKWSTPIAVPLNASTLNTDFWLGKKWTEILPDPRQPDARLAGVDVKYIAFHAQTDAYRNIFLTAKNMADGKEKRTRLYSTFEDQ